MTLLRPAPAPPAGVAVGAGVLALFVALTAWLLDFRLAYADSRLPGGLGDPVLVLYFLEWGGRSIAHGLRGFWDANFYFPARGVITLSDHMLGPAALAKLFRLFWDDGVASYNALFLGSFVLSGAGASWVLRRNGASLPAAVLAGIMFAFSPYRSSQQPHLQVLLVQWIPLTLWYWDRLLARPSAGGAAAFVACYLLHVTGGTYLAYLIHFALAIVLLQHRREWRRLVSWPALRVLAPVLAVGAAALLFLFYPYLASHRELGLERGASEFAFYGASLRSYVAPGVENELWGSLLGWRQPENQLFAGAVATMFAVTGLFSLRRRWDGPDPGRPFPARALESTWARGVVWSGLFFFLLSFSSVFTLLARILPGLSAMRVPTRVYPFVSLALALLAAAAIDRLLLWAPRRRLLVATAIGAVLCFELRSEVSWTPWPRDEAELRIFHEIARRPEVRVVLHLPMLQDAREAHYMWDSTLHWKPIANGYSGFAPATYLELRRRLREEPLADETIDHLIELGITHVGAHPRLLRAPRGRRQLVRWESHFAGGDAPRIRLVTAAGNDRLYELLPRSTPVETGSRAGVGPAMAPAP